MYIINIQYNANYIDNLEYQELKLILTVIYKSFFILNSFTKKKLKFDSKKTILKKNLFHYIVKIIFAYV
jgi:hypothetical protein